MKLIYQLIPGLMFFAAALPQNLLSSSIRIESPSGDMVEVGVDGSEPFFDVLGKIDSYFNEKELVLRDFQNDSGSVNPSPQGISIDHTQWNLIVSHAGILAKKNKKEKNWRDYDAGIEKKKAEKILFITRTLAFDSLIGIGRKKNDLKDAGKDLEDVHPLRFLETIFLDEEAKAGMPSIRDAFAWVRDGFYDGIMGSLKEEHARNNVVPFINEFAKNLEIDSQWLTPFIDKEDWKGFVNILIDKVPRKIDPNRFKNI